MEGVKNPLVMNNSSTGIIEFGKYGRHLQSNSFLQVNSVSEFSDFFIQNYPSDTWKDGRTLINLPAAWIAGRAKSLNLNEYYLFRLSDEAQDVGSPGARIPYSDEEEALIASYGTATAAILRLLTLQYSDSSSDMYLVIYKVSDLLSSSIPSIPSPSANSQRMEIKLSSLAGGSKSKPIKVTEEIINISWTCINCSGDVSYRIRIKGVKPTLDPKPQPISSTKSNSCSFSLADGTYRVLISGTAGQNGSIRSSSTYIEVNSTGGFGWLFLLFLVGLGFGGYYYWKRQRDKQLQRLTESPSEGLSLDDL